jgi:YebC/PmpR family DNA-binding regulatory protein
MSGHSKWATIKHRKGAADARRGKVFTKLIKEISIAARIGGGDPDSNPRLRTAMQAARQENMPQDNIKRAILRGMGQLEGGTIEEIHMEGYGPGGVAMIVHATTDNRNRTVNEIRHVFTRFGGKIGEPGSVARLFSQKGYLVVPKEKASEEKLMGIVLDAGAEDLRDDGSNWEVITPPESYEPVRHALVLNECAPTVAEVSMLPASYVHLEGSQAHQLMRLMEELEDHEDVQHVYANFDISEKEIQEAVAPT